MPTSEEPGVAKVFILGVVGLIFIAAFWLVLTSIQIGLNHCAFDFSALVAVNV
jgi:hypothetical protein